MRKPENMCDELGCTRDWTKVIAQYGQPTLSPKGSTAMSSKLCDPCAEKHEAKAALAGK